VDPCLRMFLLRRASNRRYIPIGNPVTLAHAPRAPILSLRGRMAAISKMATTTFMCCN